MFLSRQRIVVARIAQQQIRQLTAGNSATFGKTLATGSVVLVAGGLYLNESEPAKHYKERVRKWSEEKSNQVSSFVTFINNQAREFSSSIFHPITSHTEGLIQEDSFWPKVSNIVRIASVAQKPSTERDAIFKEISYDEFKADHEGRIWVAWEGGVYDMTDFMASHPGGPARIAMVEGLDLGKFWDIYKLHDRKHIHKLMEKFRVGTLSSEDFSKVQSDTLFDDPYANDPVRNIHPNSRIASTRPWNIEPPLEELQKNFITPNDLFFVRNHNPVPDIDIASWSLTIDPCPQIGINQSKSFSFEDILHKLPKHEILSTLQCAGNRQRDFIEESRPLFVAPSWENGAIGTAKWVGVRVRDVLEACGADVDALALGKKSAGSARIVNFIAEDVDETGVQYASVLPIEKVIDPWADVILAYEMNGEPLSRDHGFPIRLIAPGTAGCRNAKWVNNIVIMDRASELDSGSTLDRHFSPAVSFEDHRIHCVQCGEDENKPCNNTAATHHNARADVEFKAGPVIQNMPITSAITTPANGSVVEADLGNRAVPVKGYAWGGGGRGVVRVEVSTDGGQNFFAAQMLPPPEQPLVNGHPAPEPELGVGRHWTWRHFEDSMPLPPEAQAELAKGQPVNVRVCSKAIDGDFNSQPERMRSTWNTLGICANHYSCVEITVKPKETKETPSGTPDQNNARTAV